MTATVTDQELVVLLDDQRRPIGSAPKADVHTAHTPLHLAFSSYAFDRSGTKLLLTCCGHPAPGEDLAEAMTRRIRQELGLTPTDVELALPDFAYTATMADGTMENEFCPVFRIVVDGDPVPDPAEVAEWTWVEWADLVVAVEHAPWLISPWAALQIPQLGSLG
jgi:isopentenyl-diphosphate delta-isomerase